VYTVARRRSWSVIASSPNERSHTDQRQQTWPAPAHRACRSGTAQLPA
jgi:hypothetical protein